MLQEKEKKFNLYWSLFTVQAWKRVQDFGRKVFLAYSVTKLKAI